MKRLIGIIAISSILVQGCENDQLINQEIISHEGEQILVGRIDLQGLSVEPYSVWFEENYTQYQVDKTSLEGVSVDDVEIKLFLGTWCSDSQLQVPQFYKILTHMGYDKTMLEIIGLDNHPDRDLTSPQHEEEGLNIEFVPTMIFYRDGQEIGRIIEFPKESLEKDMAEIVGIGV